MHRYIARRVLLMVPTLLMVSVLVFAIMRIVPGDVASMLAGEEASREQVETLREQLGLTRPYYVQYLDWIGNVLAGNLGTSLFTGRTVLKEVERALPITVEIAVLSMIVSTTLGLVLGIVSAARQNTGIDYSARLLSISGLAVPEFLLGTLLLLLPALWFGWIPKATYVPIYVDPGVNLAQFALPCVALGTYLAAFNARIMRSSLLEVMRQDYMRTAMAKGLRETIVIMRHGIKNALLPVFTLVGYQFSHLIGGTLIIETVFNLPGMAKLTVDALLHRDFITVQSTILLFAVATTVLNLVIDLFYGYLDPRIRFT